MEHVNVIRLIIAEDCLLLREGLMGLFMGIRSVKVVDATDNGKDLLRMLLKADWDVVLMAEGLPNGDEGEILRRAREHKQKPVVIVLGMQRGRPPVLRVLKSGAGGYISRASTFADLLQAIRKVAAGGIYVGEEFLEQMVGRVVAQHKVLPHEALTQREYTIFLKLAAGIAPARIAQELNLSPSTVSTHRGRILDKLSLRNNAELVRYACQFEL